MDYPSRLAKARRHMEVSGIDALMLSSGLDLPYLTGYTASPYERLTMLVVREGAEAVLVVPELEAPLVDTLDGLFAVRPWSETEDPTAIVAGLAGRATTAALGDQTWSTFLIQLQKHLPDTSFVSATPLTRELRMRKGADELARLRAAGAAADRVAAAIPSMRFSGRAEHVIGQQIRELTVQEGHDFATFAIVASGPNSASPHHHTGDRIIEHGDSIVIDFGGDYEGYQSDTSRSFHVGEPGPEVQEAFDVLIAAQAAGVDAVRPGVSCESVDRATRGVIDSAGYGEYFIHRTGHGIGLATHEEPYIVEGNVLVLEASMSFSIEPGIYVPGEFGMRIEDIVAVTEDGVENFNNSDHSMRIVE